MHRSLLFAITTAGAVGALGVACSTFGEEREATTTQDAGVGGDASGSDAAPRDAAGDRAVSDARADVVMPAGNIVFVTNAAVAIGANFVAAANAVCNGEALAAGLSGKTWLPWLSQSGATLSDSLPANAVWFLPDGKRVGTLAELLNTGPDNAIAVNAAGASPLGVEPAVWTGTNADGSGGPNCSDWTDKFSGSDARRGDRAKKGNDWTAAGTLQCSATAHLYCFQR